jgi:hypothetical protein
MLLGKMKFDERDVVVDAWDRSAKTNHSEEQRPATVLALPVTHTHAACCGFVNG